MHCKQRIKNANDILPEQIKTADGKTQSGHFQVRSELSDPWYNWGLALVLPCQGAAV